FWSNNILAFAPFLAVSVRGRIPARGGDDVQVNLIGTWFEKNVTGDNGAAFLTGVKQLTPWWKIDGRWPSEGEGLVGVRLAQALKAGPDDDLFLQSTTRDGSSIEALLRVSGILSTGSDEDSSIIADLGTAQILSGQEGRVGRIEISALTNPEDNLARRDP